MNRSSDESEQSVSESTTVRDSSPENAPERDFWIEVLRSCLVATLILDHEGKLIFVNEEAEDLLGHTGEKLSGLHVSSFGNFLRSPNGKQMDSEAMPFQRVLETGESVSRWKAAALTRFGELRQVLFNLAPVRRENMISGLVVSVQAVSLAPPLIPESIRESPSPEELAAQRNMERSLRLQEALFELSKSKVTDLDQFMEQLTSVDAETIQTERVGVWLFDPTQTALELKKLYLRTGQRFAAEEMRIERSQCPRYFEAIHQKRNLATADAVNDPRTSELADFYLRSHGISSILDVPIWLGGKVVGIVCHEHVGPSRTWSTYERQFTTSIAGMMSVALETQERVTAETTLRKNEERLRLLTEQLPALVWTTDVDLKITSVAGSGLVPLNLKPNEVEGGAMYELFQVKSPTHPLNLPQQNALRGESVTYDGDWQGRNYQIHVEPFRDPNHNIIGTIGVALDTTDRRRAEDEIQLLQAIVLAMTGVESMDDALAIVLEKVCLATGWVLGQAWVYDAAAAKLMLCKRWYSREPATDVFHDASADLTLAPGKGLPGRVWLTRKPEWHLDVSTEAEIFIRVESARKAGIKAGLAVPVMDGDQILAVMEFYKLDRIMIDDRLINLISSIGMQLGTVIQRKQVEYERKQLLEIMQKLADSSRQRAAELEAVVSSIADGVLVVDGKSRLMMANRAALGMLGIDKLNGERPDLETLVAGMTIKDSADRVLKFDELPFVQALHGKTIVEKILGFMPEKSGRGIQVRITSAPIESTDGQSAGAVSILRDVTEQLEFAQLKDQFIRVTAHELKTPLSIMKGYSEMILRQGSELPEQNQKMLEAIDRGADRIVRIVNDLLEISRFGKLEMPMATHLNFNLSAFITEAVERNALDATHHQIHLGSVSDVIVRGDRGRIEQVLNNLLQNARKYSPEGGDIEVSVEIEDDKGVVCVKDQGVGIPLDKQSHIFQQFYRAHTDSPNDYGGMGVGLYISREIIRRHRGEMWFRSEPGKGSTFCFSLPVVPPAVSQEANAH